MNKGKIGLAVGLLAITSFAGIKTNALTEEPILTKTINKTVIEQFASNSSNKYKIVKSVKKDKIVKEENKSEKLEENKLEENKIVKLDSENVVEPVANTYIEQETKQEVVRNNNIVVETVVVEEKEPEVVSEPEIVNEPVNVQTSGEILVEDNTDNKKEEIEIKETDIKENIETPEKEGVFTEIKEEDEKSLEESEKLNEDSEIVSLSVSGWVTENLNIRTNRGESAQIIGVLEKGEEISGEVEEGWIKINYNGMVGYISERYINTTEAVLPEVVEEPAVEEPVAEQPVIEEPVEEEPAVEEPVVEEPIEEEPVVEEPVIEEPVEEEPAVEEPVQDNTVKTGDSISDMVQAAYNLVGTNYQWAGNSPAEGFDCSGFTSYLYREYAGVELSRVTTGQAGNGYAVSKENIQPGDIILFQNDWSDHIDHVGIYVGNGSYIHAATEERGVVVDSTDGSYFQNNVVGVRRIIN